MWAGAELRPVGLLALLVFPAVVLWHLRGWFTQALATRWVRLVLGLLFVFGMVSMVHDMLYQRALWLLLGAALALPAVRRHP